MVAILIWQVVSPALKFIFLFMRFACSVSICIGFAFIRAATAFMGPALVTYRGDKWLNIDFLFFTLM